MRDKTPMVITREDGDYCFPLYWNSDLISIKYFNQDYLNVIDRDVVELLEVFTVRSSQELVELDRHDD